MKIISTSNGVQSEHDIPAGVRALVMQPGIGVKAPDAYTIDPRKTIKCMEEMTQQQWVHISTGGIFPVLFNTLFGDSVDIPPTIEEVNEGDIGVAHACGLIVLYVEAMFEGKKEVFLQQPETHLHPKQCYNLMTVLYMIQRIGGPAPRRDDGKLEDEFHERYILGKMGLNEDEITEVIDRGQGN